MKRIGKSIILFLIIPCALISQEILTVNHKLDPVLKAWFSCSPQQAAFSKVDSDGQFLFNGFIQTDNPHELEAFGTHIRSGIGDIVTATVPMDRISEIAQLASVRRIQAASFCRMALDVSAPEIRADQVWDGSLGASYTGKDVIVGIVDSGIDWSHPDFRDENDSTRILFIWDQNGTPLNPPAGFYDGNEYTRNQINDELDGSQAGLVQGMDVNGHGTHVAGIAAGNGRGTGNGQPSNVYKGIAYEADLIVVKGLDSDNLRIANDYIVDGVNYIFQKADELGKPAVVNLSLGTQEGPHDGTSDFEYTLNELLNSNPGKAIVVAAGNDGDKDIHMRDEFGYQNDSLSVKMNILSNPTTGLNHILFEGWGKSSGLKVTVITPSNDIIGPVSVGYNMYWPGPTEWLVNIDNESAYPFQNHRNNELKLTVKISDNENQSQINNFETGEWTIILEDGWGRYDFWMYEWTVPASITSTVDYSTLLVEPGNARRVITVGSYISRIQWPSLSGVWGPGGLTLSDRSVFSGIGPTRPNFNDPAGRQKPDITAPGEFILSTLSSSKTSYLHEHYLASDSVHCAKSGTSMAAPHITGLVALMFQADPTLDYSRIQAHLIDGARTDGFTGPIWNAFWGYGKADAYETMRLLTNCCPEPTPLPITYRLEQNFPNPFNGMTRIVFSLGQSATFVQMNVFDVRGRWIKTLFDGPADRGNHAVRWEGNDSQGKSVASGIYFYQFKTDRYSETRKMIYVR